MLLFASYSNQNRCERIPALSIKCYYVGKKTWQAVLVFYPESKSDFGLASQSHEHQICIGYYFARLSRSLRTTARGTGSYHHRVDSTHRFESPSFLDTSKVVSHIANLRAHRPAKISRQINNTRQGRSHKLDMDTSRVDSLLMTPLVLVLY